VRVLLDVQRTIQGGAFFRVGQRLFEGVYLNTPPLGRAVDDLGQALTSTWLTWSVTQASIYRCRTLAPWSTQAAVAWMDQRTTDALVVVRDALIEDVLPLLKLRIRHHAGPRDGDAADFSENMVRSLARAVDTVVKGLRTQLPTQAIEQARRTHAGAS
jgi:hypothetical protein